MDTEYLELLKTGYHALIELHRCHGLDIPKNMPIEKQGELLLRNLDCAVIETIHQFNKEEGLHEFDSVRGFFGKGKIYIQKQVLKKKTIFK